MRKTSAFLTLFILLVLVSCQHNKTFCGPEVDFEETKSLVSKGLESPWQRDCSSIVLRFQKIVGQESLVNFEIDFSANDTISVRVLNLENENLAKKLSCVIVKENLIQESKVAYIFFDWGIDSVLIKYE